MYCFQCEQTIKGTGCTVHGACGKDPQISALHDLLLAIIYDISRYAHRARQFNAHSQAIDRFVLNALFSTVTNVNFDIERLVELLQQGIYLRESGRHLYQNAVQKAGQTPESLPPEIELPSHASAETLMALATRVSLRQKLENFGQDVMGLQELVLYGLKGMAAYAHHARILGQSAPEIYAFFHEALDFLASGPEDIPALTQMALRVGEVNLKAMEMLDTANTRSYGDPEPTPVRVTPLAGKAILVSGHDLRDLKMLLEQTEGKGINIYTHSEMLPCLAYPAFKQHKHLVGNYGGAWQDQRKEFEAFPGAILMTTNCIQRPKRNYQNRIFTTDLVGWPGVTHIPARENGDKDFTPVIEAALAAPGFEKDADAQSITIGFAHKTVLSIADKVVEAVKSGKIRHFFLVGGCDGIKPERSYYTNFATRVPADCLILTLACGKYRFNKLEFGDIEGIPRLLDCGQCNDAYSAIRIAQALAEHFQCGVNDLPLSLILSWFEQKAVCILLTLLHLGIQDIRIGPSLPAFISPNVLAFLETHFKLKPITTPEADLAAILDTPAAS